MLKTVNYRGFCLQNGLPAHGQRTKSNGASARRLESS